jgi:high-affinity iron transporter
MAAIVHAAEPATVLHLLDYIAVDYAEAVENGRVKNEGEYQEMQEFAGQAHALMGALPDNPARGALQAAAEQLARDIDAKAQPSEVASKATSLRWDVINAYRVQVAPRSAPDLARAPALYAEHCASCHGADGRGDGPAGKGLDPAPSDFHDRQRMSQRSVHGLYNTITLGVEGTGMAAFRQLGEDERWALAFHAANFAADGELRARGEALWRAGQGPEQFPDLGNVVTLSANEVRARGGDDAVAVQAYLRSRPQAVAADKPSPIEFARTTLTASLEAYRRGESAQAAQLAIQAYLEGFELAEASLQNVDGALVTHIEREMMAYRGLVQAGAPVEQAATQQRTVDELLGQASERLGGAEMSPAATFVASLVILLREGAEAILVVAAILAFLKRSGRTDARRWVHAGWISALALGVATWFASRHLVAISGADREVTEGVTALVAAAMLLYVGYWLHSKSHSQAWQKFIGDKVSGALSAGTVWTLAVVSFLAVYREAFETVLFYQALATQAGEAGRTALLGGVAAGAALLVGVAWAILRASVRLPLGLFFSASAIVLLVLAVVFTGQGIAALQEAGVIGADPLGSLRLPLLGIYPTLQTLLAQCAALAVSAAVLWKTARSRSR